jgi:mannose-6-phosphate isomerase-like protein (cupin superfamily)
VPIKIDAPTVVPVPGTPPKKIEEYFGRLNTGETGLSIARMVCPQGWEEPAQSPHFDEYTLVLSGMLVVEHAEGELEIRAGEAVQTLFGERVRYRTPEPGGAEYIAVCVPAFSPEGARREES